MPVADGDLSIARVLGRSDARAPSVVGRKPQDMCMAMAMAMAMASAPS